MVCKIKCLREDHPRRNCKKEGPAAAIKSNPTIDEKHVTIIDRRKEKKIRCAPQCPQCIKITTTTSPLKNRTLIT